MKHLISTLILGAILLMAACSRNKIIPDDELALIFRDAYLTNAYIGNRNVDIDSLNIYEPIFEKYGYTTQDVQYTIGNFSKRKSARLSDVVDQAVKMLDTEGKALDLKVSILDTVNNVARRAFTRTIYSDSLIRVRTLKDTSKLNIVLKNIKTGEYNISMKYYIDSLDQNENLRAEMWMERKDSAKTRTNNYNFTLFRNREETFTRKMIADTTIGKIVLDMIIFRDKPKRPSITIRNIEIKYTPETEIAVDSLYERQMNIQIFADKFFNINEKDSL